MLKNLRADKNKLYDRGLGAWNFHIHKINDHFTWCRVCQSFLLLFLNSCIATMYAENTSTFKTVLYLHMQEVQHVHHQVCWIQVPLPSRTSPSQFPKDINTLAYLTLSKKASSQVHSHYYLTVCQMAPCRVLLLSTLCLLVRYMVTRWHGMPFFIFWFETTSLHRYKISIMLTFVPLSHQ